MDVLNIKDLKKKLNNSSQGILFCIGTSLISRIIEAKTREYDDEIVPSHVAIVYKGFVYESTSAAEKVGNKKIPSGVRRYLLSDFFKAEKGKQTMYVYMKAHTMYNTDINEMEKHIHRPYGIDNIVDFLLKDKSDGDSKGLICSQYANLVFKILPEEPCPSPAQLFRKCMEGQE